MEVLKIEDTDLVHLLKQKLMIVLLYLDEIFVRERNNLFFCIIFLASWVSQNTIIWNVLAQLKIERDCCQEWWSTWLDITEMFIFHGEEKKIFFKVAAQAKLRLCAPYWRGDSKLSSCQSLYSPRSRILKTCQHGQWLSPHNKGESHLWHLNKHLNYCQTKWSWVISVLIFILIHLD